MSPDRLLSIVEFHANVAKGLLPHLHSLKGNHNMERVNISAQALNECYRNLYSAIQEIAKEKKRTDLEHELLSIKTA